jgi:hypothetical protein
MFAVNRWTISLGTRQSMPSRLTHRSAQGASKHSRADA